MNTFEDKDYDFLREDGSWGFHPRPRNLYKPGRPSRWKLAWVTFVAALTIAFGAQARDLSITMNDALQQAYVEALDAYVKAGGINKATAAVALLQLLQQAAQAPEKPADANQPNGGAK